MTLIAVAAGLLSFVAGPLFRILTQRRYVKVSHVILSDFVPLYSLRRKVDNNHIVEVAARDGVVWFREKEPGFSLVCCDPRKVYVDASNGAFSVFLTVEEDCRDDLEIWSRMHQERMVGIVVDGEVVYTQPLQVVLRSRIAVPNFGTKAEAEGFQTRLLSEGFEVFP